MTVVLGLGRIGPNRSPSLIRRKASLISGFNSLLGTIIFLFHFVGNLDCKSLILLVLSMGISDVRGQNRRISLYLPS
jgi:hypothetical protein